MEITKHALHLNSVKKHSVRYDANDEADAVSALYIKKTKLNAPYPETVVITIETLPTEGE